MKEYVVIYEHGLDDEGWSAYVPDLPGCIAAAKSRPGLEVLIREAIEFHIEGLGNQQEPVPEPSSQAGLIAVWT